MDFPGRNLPVFALVGGVLSVSCVTSVRAQTEPIDVASAVACFERKVYDPRVACDPGVRSASAYLRPGKYPPATVEAVLEGLASLALSSQDMSVRIAAVTRIAMAGSEGRIPGIATVPHLSHLYAASSHADVKATAVRLAGRQADEVSAAAFLESVAVEQPIEDPYELSIPEMAIISLTELGQPGRAALSRLAQRNGVSEPRARARLMAVLKDLEPPSL